MVLELVKLTDLSGPRATIYTLLDIESQVTLFERFVMENSKDYLADIQNILARLRTIAHKTGATENFFKLHEGNIGDSVVALYDTPEKHLRLYCIRLGNSIIILGGGGLKKVRALQEDPKLFLENKILRLVAKYWIRD